MSNFKTIEDLLEKKEYSWEEIESQTKELQISPMKTAFTFFKEEPTVKTNIIIPRKLWPKITPKERIKYYMKEDESIQTILQQFSIIEKYLIPDWLFDSLQ